MRDIVLRCSLKDLSAAYPIPVLRNWYRMFWHRRVFVHTEYSKPPKYDVIPYLKSDVFTLDRGSAMECWLRDAKMLRKQRIGILYRDFEFKGDELAAATAAFNGDGRFLTDSRMDFQNGDLVIGRYSVLPFYKEQERDLARVGAKLINSYAQHRYIADMEWAKDLEGLTPRTWRDLSELPDTGSFVIKGETNSRKHLWNTHMFAKTRADVGAVVNRLLDDTLIGQQQLVAREYVPLSTYMHGIGGVPISKEFRCFMLDGQILAVGYYWASHVEDLADLGVKPDPREVPRDLLDEVGRRVGDKCRFYVVDVAEKASGGWMVVELNDGQMSGLSMCAPDELYGNLVRRLESMRTR